MLTLESHQRYQAGNHHGNSHLMGEPHHLVHTGSVVMMMLGVTEQEV